MSNTFTNVFRKVINSTTSSGVTGGTALSTVMSALTRFKNYLQTHSGQTDSFIMALTQCSDLIPEAVLTDGTMPFSSTDVSAWTCEVPADIAPNLIGGLSDAIHNNADTTELAGITITDAGGYLYNFIDVRSNAPIEGMIPIFSTVYYPNHVSELLMYRDPSTGKYFLNSLVRTADFAKPEAERILPTQLADIVSSMSIMKNGYASAVISENLALIGATGDDILSQLNSLIVARKGTIMGAATAAWNAFNQLYPLRVGVGKYESLFNVIYDMIESSTLNQWIASAIGLLQTGSLDASTVSIGLSDAASSRFSSVREFAKSFTSAFVKGGVYGACLYVVDYLKQMTTGLTDSNGTLSFTDNDRLVPAQYIVGMVSNIINAASTLVATVASMFSRIAGAAIAVIGMIGSNIIQALTYDYDSTNAALSQSELCSLPTAPMALLKGEIWDSELRNSDIRSLIGMGYTLFTMEVPGGFVFMGPGNITQGNIYSWRFEFHPAITATKSNMIQRIWEIYYGDADAVDLDASNHPGPVHLVFTFDPHQAAIIRDIWSDSVLSTVYSNDANLQTLTSADDLQVEKNCLINSAVFVLWASTFTSGLWNGCNMNSWFKIEKVNDSYRLVPVANSSGLSYYTGLCQAFFFFTSASYFYPTISGQTVEVVMNHNLSSSVEFPSWRWFLELCFSSEGTYGYSSAYGNVHDTIVNDFMYFNSVEPIDHKFEHLLLVPKYDRSTFWFWVVASAVVTAVIAGVAVAVALKVRKTIFKRRALNQAKVDQAWNHLSSDPSPENYSAYRAAVKSNNRWARLIGGTRYDYVNYWNGDVRGDGSTTGDILNKLKDKFTESNDTAGDSVNELGVDSVTDLSKIYYSIVGLPTN